MNSKDFCEFFSGHMDLFGLYRMFLISFRFLCKCFGLFVPLETDFDRL